MSRIVIIFGFLCGVASVCQGWQMPYMTGQSYPQNQNMQLQGLGFQPADLTQRSSIPHLMPDSNSKLAPNIQEPAIKGGRHPDDDKRYSIAKLNQAARHRNPFLDTLGGDPYSYSSNVLSRSHVAVRKSKRSVSAMPAAQSYNGKYPSYQMNQQNEKLYDVATLNHAARHRNVYLDSLGADPYGGSSSSIVTRQHITVNHHRKKRGTKEEKTETGSKSNSVKKRLGLY